MPDRLTMNLDGANIRLRRLTVADVTDTYVRWMNDPDITRFLESRFHAQTPESIHAYVEALLASGKERLWAICLKDSNRHIGNIKLGAVDPNHKRADIGLLIGERDQWGKGYASEAIALVSRFAFEKLDLIRVWAGCYATNESSAKAFERCGFRREGLLRGDAISEGHPVDVIVLGLLKGELKD